MFDLRDPIWQFVGALGTIVGMIVSVVTVVLVYLRQRPRKHLSYGIISDTILLSVIDELEGKLRLLYQGKPVSDIHSVELRLSYSGNMPIRSADFETPIGFEIGGSGKILSAEITDNPREIDASISIKDQGLSLQPTLFNDGDSLTIKMLIDQFDGTIKPHGRIAGLREVETERETFTWYSNSVGRLGMVRVALFGSLSFFSIGMASWASTKIPYQVDVASFVLGLGVAALTGMAWMELNGWWSTVTKPFKPETKGNPAEFNKNLARVNFASILAVAQAIIFIGVVMAIVIMVIANS